MPNFKPNYKLMEVQCTVCHDVVGSVYVEQNIKRESLPDIICRKHRGSCLRSYKSSLIVIPEDLVEAKNGMQKKARKAKVKAQKSENIESAEDMSNLSSDNS